MKIRPTFVSIEPTNMCNLNCPLCPNSNVKKKGTMTVEDFKKILSNIGPEISRYSFHLNGEPLLNKDVFEMVRICKSMGNKTGMETNGTLLHKFDHAKIFGSGIDEITFSVDGVDQKTYEKYRVGGDYQRVMSNIGYLIQRREAGGHKHPKIILQFLLMNNNKHQVQQILKIAKQTGVDAVKFKSIHSFSRHDEKTDRILKEQQILREPDKRISRCAELFEILNVAWNGDLVLCCKDFFHSVVLGNLKSQTLDEILSNNPKFMETRKKILDRSLPLCRDCEAYKGEVNYVEIR